MVPALCSLLWSHGGTCGAGFVDVPVGVYCTSLPLGSEDGANLDAIVQSAWGAGLTAVFVLVPEGSQITLDQTVFVPSFDLSGTFEFSVSLGVSQEDQCYPPNPLTPANTVSNPVEIHPPDGRDAFQVDGILLIQDDIEIVGDAWAGPGTIIEE